LATSFNGTNFTYADGDTLLYPVIQANGTTTTITFGLPWNTFNSSFAVPVNGTYSITVAVNWDPAYAGFGTFRGVALSRTRTPPNWFFTAEPVDICIKPVHPSLGTRCTYTGYFHLGDTFFVQARHDANVSIPTIPFPNANHHIQVTLY
jgi:hypothetical protein